MKLPRNMVSHLCFILLLVTISNGQTGNSPPRLELSSDSNGKITVVMEIPLQQISSTKTALLASGYVISFALVPFEYTDLWTILSAPDIRVAVLSHGPGYTLLCLLYRAGQKKITLSLENAIEIEETANNIAKLEFDYSYPLLSEADKAVAGLPEAVSKWDTLFVLPKEYSQYQVNTYPSGVTQVDARTYHLSHKLVQSNPGKVWIVFPDPRQTSLSYAKILLGLLFGIFSALFQIVPLRDRRISVLLIILILSAIFLCIATYLLFTLPMRLDLAVWVAVSLPHVLVSGIACLYLSVARKFQATVGGTVSMDGIPTSFATVRLVRCENGNETTVATKDRLDRGQYEFHVWVRSITRFKVMAKCGLTDFVESDEFDLKACDTRPVGDLNLSTPNIIHDTDTDDELPTMVSNVPSEDLSSDVQ